MPTSSTASTPAMGPARLLASLRRRLGTVAWAFREHGTAGALVAVAGRLPRRLLAIEWYQLREVVMPNDAATDPWPEIRRAGPDDAEDLAAVGHVSADEARTRLADGDVAYLGTADGVPVAYVWFRAGSWREGDVEYVLRDDERWGYDLFVASSQRGRRIAPGLMVAAGRALGHDGADRTIAVIDYLNEPSRRAARHYGGRPVAACTTVAAAGLVALRQRTPDGASWSVARRSSGISRSTPPRRLGHGGAPPSPRHC